MRHNIVLCPTLAVFELRAHDAKATPLKARGYENMLKFVGLYHRAGGRIVVGSHSEVPHAQYGWAYQRELELLVEAGLTPMQLAASITDKLKKYVSDPHVTVVVTAMNSRRVYMLGEVAHTGPMALTPNMTILQALAQAGFSQFANTKGIYVLRKEGATQKKIPVNYKKLIKGEAMDQNIILKPGDTIVVP